MQHECRPRFAGDLADRRQHWRPADCKPCSVTCTVHRIAPAPRRQRGAVHVLQRAVDHVPCD
eukprot:6968618-Prymnesium_polylepis.1